MTHARFRGSEDRIADRRSDPCRSGELVESHAQFPERGALNLGLGDVRMNDGAGGGPTGSRRADAEAPTPSAVAFSYAVTTRSAWATSPGCGAYSSLRIATWLGWMQAAPRKPRRRERWIVARKAARSRKSATVPRKPKGRMPTERAAM